MTDRLMHPPVLLYHSIEELGAGGAGRRLFAQQMAYLARRGFRALTPAGFLRAVDEGEWEPKSLLLTFDDGCLDFYTEAFPVLQESGMTATVFLVGDVVDGGMDAWRGPRFPYMPPVMGWAEVLELREKGVHFGAHGLSHAKLGQLGQLEQADLAAEVAGSKTRIEDRLGEAISLFSYPYGDCSPAARAAVQSAGYSAAFGVSPLESSRFEIFRRIVRPARTSFPFRLRVSAAYPALRRMSHLVRGRTR